MDESEGFFFPYGAGEGLVGLIHRAHTVNSTRDQDEREMGFTPESEGNPVERLRTAISALVCAAQIAIGRRMVLDDSLYEGIAMLQSLEKDMQEIFPSGKGSGIGPEDIYPESPLVNMILKWNGVE